MKRIIVVTGVCIFSLFIFSNFIYAQAAWVNNEGCYCGIHPLPPVRFECIGSGTNAERSWTAEQMEYWNSYADIFDPCVDSGKGAPENGTNEVNTFITSADASSIYGVTLASNTYGMAIIRPAANFSGTFNGCKDFSAIGCGSFTEADVLINANFSGGWTTDPTNFNKALVQTTALHEIGHAWGAHHVFDISATASNSYSCMNYMYDYGGRYITRMDANTIRDAYSSREQSVTDIGIFPLTYGNGQYNENYTSATLIGGNLDIGTFFVQNLGTATAQNVVITFYLSTDTIIESSDYSIFTATYPSIPVNADYTYNPPAMPVPPSVANGSYYVGAIVRVWGSEDSIRENNKWLLVNSGASGPTSALQVTVTGSVAPQPTPSTASTPSPSSFPDCCTSWCDNNYVELSVSPSSISSGGQLQLSYDCYFSDANYYGVPVDIYLALIRDPVVTNNASTTGSALGGGAVYLFTRGLSNNYLFTGRVYDPTWSYVAFPPLATSGTLNIWLRAPSGNYVWATAFRRRDTGQFVRTDLQVENSNQFSVR